MQYKDSTDSNTGAKYINGRYVGVRIGSPLQDAANPGVDSYDEAIRSSKHFGTITQDAKADIKYEPKE